MRDRRRLRDRHGVFRTQDDHLYRQRVRVRREHEVRRRVGRHHRGSCTTTSQKLCAFKWQVPCSADTDCGEGFVCHPSVSGGCGSSGRAVSGGPNLTNADTFPRLRLPVDAGAPDLYDDRVFPRLLRAEGDHLYGRHQCPDYFAGLPIDARAELPEGATLDGLNGLRTYLLGRREDFFRQFDRKLLGYALGRAVQLSDQPLLDDMRASLKANGEKPALAVELVVRSPQFRNVRGRDFSQASNTAESDLSKPPLP